MIRAINCVFLHILMKLESINPNITGMKNNLGGFGHYQLSNDTDLHFYPTALKGCRGIVFTHGVRLGGRAIGRAVGNSLSGLYLRNRKV